MAIRERSFKYLDAQQVSQQISIFFKAEFLALLVSPVIIVFTDFLKKKNVKLLNE